MKKYVVMLMVILGTGICCAMDQSAQPDVMSYQFDCDPTFFQQNTCPQTWRPSKEAIRFRKQIWREHQLSLESAKLCSEIVRTYNNQPIMDTTPETRHFAALYLQLWTTNLTFAGYPLSDWDKQTK